jgi:hypothetical protein
MQSGSDLGEGSGVQQKKKLTCCATCDFAIGRRSADLLSTKHDQWGVRRSPLQEWKAPFTEMWEGVEHFANVDTQEFFRLIKEHTQKKLQQDPIKPAAN